VQRFDKTYAKLKTRVKHHSNVIVTCKIGQYFRVSPNQLKRTNNLFKTHTLWVPKNEEKRHLKPTYPCDTESHYFRKSIAVTRWTNWLILVKRARCSGAFPLRFKLSLFRMWFAGFENHWAPIGPVAPDFNALLGQLMTTWRQGAGIPIYT